MVSWEPRIALMAIAFLAVAQLAKCLQVADIVSAAFG
jgi:hypothetical protein